MFVFASFKRSSAASAPSNTTTGTEKDSGTDYADLEKRADGRWSVRSRPGTLKAPVDATGIDTKSYGFLPAHVGVLLFTMFGLMIGVVFMGVTAANIAQNGTSSPARG